jgi:hypothetical protein
VVRGRRPLRRQRDRDDFTLLPSRWHRVLANGIDIVLILSVTVTLAGLAGGRSHE